MRNNLPPFLEYFLFDILEDSYEFSIRKMFWAYAIYKNNKIFALFVDGEFYFRENIFIKNNSQFSYARKWKTVFLPYFLVDESILEDREKLFLYIEKSLDY